MPKVSVIIPVYNAQDFIGETLDSVLAQTFTAYEILLVDDGSTDRSKEIIQAYVRKDPARLRYIYQANQGPGAARNHAIREARGEYLAFLDADDLWMPQRLEEGVRVLDARPEIALVHAQTIRIGEKGEPTEQAERDERYLSGNIFKYLLTRKAHITCPTVLLRKSCLAEAGIFDESPQCIGVEDRDLWLRVTRRYPVAFIDKNLGQYRIRPTSLSRDQKKMLDRKIYVINKVCSQGHLIFDKCQALAMVYKELGDIFLLEKNFPEAKSYYLQAVAAWPFFLGAWLNLAKSIFNVKTQNHASLRT